MSEKTREAWVVWINADGTEGRGPMEPRHVCAAEATAHRRAHGADVQGSDAPVSKVALRLEPVQGAYGPAHAWFGPVAIEAPTEEDRRIQARLDAEAAKARARDAAIERARALGLSDEDIAALREEATA